MNSQDITPKFGKTNPSLEEQSKATIKRYTSVIGIKPEKEQYYRDLHADVWPSIIERLKKSNVSNYSIHLTELDGNRYLISYFEYSGEDFESDMQAIAADAETQRWWLETDPCQRILPETVLGQKWVQAEMVFFMQ